MIMDIIDIINNITYLLLSTFSTILQTVLTLIGILNHHESRLSVTLDLLSLSDNPFGVVGTPYV